MLRLVELLLIHIKDSVHGHNLVSEYKVIQSQQIAGNCIELSELHMITQSESDSLSLDEHCPSPSTETRREWSWQVC